MGETEKEPEGSFRGESQANRKYLAFAKKADEEGYKGWQDSFALRPRRKPFTLTIISKSSKASNPPWKT